jgi:cell division protein FtsQ
MIFKRRKKTRQASRSMPAAPSAIRWRQAYNWVFLLPPLAMAGYYLSQMAPVLPIRGIQLVGTFEHLDQDEVEATLQDYLGDGFFSVDIHELRERIRSRPWTESVSVRRIWPSRISVTVTERVPVARWDERHLLSDQAEVYVADAGEFSHLPRVHAENHAPAWALKQFYRLQTRFASVDEQVVALRVDSRGALDVELINSLTVKLGREEIERKVDRLVGIYDAEILPRREQIRRLDLRYSNGFAVAWKDEVLQGRDKASVWSNSNV